MRYEATLPLPELRRALKDRVNRLRSKKLGDGVVFEGHVYDTDPGSVQNLFVVFAALGAGAALPAGFVWRTQDNQNVPHTAKSLKALAAAVLDRNQAIWARSWALKDAIETAQAPATVDVNAGWPSP